MSQHHSLNDDLKRYSTTARTVLNLKPTAQHLGEIALYTAAVGSALALAPTAEASIIYSGIRDITLNNPLHIPMTHNVKSSSINTSTRVNLSNSAQIKLNINDQLKLFPSRSAAEVRGYANVGVLGGGVLATRTSFHPIPFGKGAVITNSMSQKFPYPAWQSGNVRLVSNIQASTFKSHRITYGYINRLNPWNEGVGKRSGFAALRLGNGDLGWLQFKLTTGDAGLINSLTLVDWAYQSIPGENIRAGDTGTLSSMPEPSSLSLMALGAAGIAALRRRRPQESHSSQIQSSTLG